MWEIRKQGFFEHIFPTTGIHVKRKVEAGVWNLMDVQWRSLSDPWRSNSTCHGRAAGSQSRIEWKADSHFINAFWKLHKQCETIRGTKQGAAITPIKLSLRSERHRSISLPFQALFRGKRWNKRIPRKNPSIHLEITRGNLFRQRALIIIKPIRRCCFAYGDANKGYRPDMFCGRVRAEKRIERAEWEMRNENGGEGEAERGERRSVCISSSDCTPLLLAGAAHSALLNYDTTDPSPCARGSPLRDFLLNVNTVSHSCTVPWFVVHGRETVRFTLRPLRHRGHLAVCNS